jgi:outer membrane protein TolC
MVYVKIFKEKGVNLKFQWKPFSGVFWGSTLLVSVAYSSTIKLNPESFSQMVLDQSPRSIEVGRRAELARLAYIRALSQLDYQVYFQTGYERSQFENISGLLNYNLEESYLMTAGIARTFSTGTRLNLDINRSNFRYDLKAASSLPDRANQATAILGLNQSLWRNFFGEATRAQIRAAELSFEISRLNRLEELEALVVEGLSLFWNAYVAQESFKEALNSRDRYLKLVESVRRKDRIGYANPGELAQVEAELEGREQNVRRASSRYLEILDRLLTFAKIENNPDVEFEVPRAIPSPSEMAPPNMAELRPIRISNLRVRAAENLLRSANSLSRSDVSLIARYGVSGTDREQAQADQEFFSGSRPKFFIGLRYESRFGSGLAEEEYRNQKSQLELEKVRQAREEREVEDRLRALERQTQALFQVAESIARQKKHRERAMQELTRTYNQGRTDIRALIETMNAAFNTQLDYLRAAGDYQVALTELKAIRDELIRD